MDGTPDVMSTMNKKTLYNICIQSQQDKAFFFDLIRAKTIVTDFWLLVSYTCQAKFCLRFMQWSHRNNASLSYKLYSLSGDIFHQVHFIKIKNVSN